MAEMNEGNFKTNIDLYEKARPGYTRESTEFLLNKLGLLNTTKPLTILELGAGTGKFTRVLVDVLKSRSNVRIIASDSQASMCEKFKEVVPGIEILHFKAESIELPDASVDAVIAAQAFHWFANGTAMKEIHRVLVPTGGIGGIWNTRNRWEVDWLSKLEDILTPYYVKYEYPGSFEICRKLINETKLFTLVKEKEDMRNALGPLTADEIVTMLSTISSVHKSTADERKDIEVQVKQLLATHPDVSKNDDIILLYKVRMLWCHKI